jgi:KaiC/GvpD/RAD55 family RecA-like ATPase
MCIAQRRIFSAKPNAFHVLIRLNIGSSDRASAVSLQNDVDNPGACRFWCLNEEQMKEKIIIKGANEHNLKNIDLEIPRNQLVVFTGVSGSGKSSLAFDTLYAEGQRRYIESLSAYARQFLGQLEKPKVDYIEGLSPAISIEQKAASNNPRSTVGTVTEIYDYLRVLYARIGEQHCHICGDKVSSQTVDQMVEHLMELPEGTKMQILAPIVQERKGEHKVELETLRQQGFVRVMVNKVVRNLDEEIKLDKKSNWRSRRAKAWSRFNILIPRKWRYCPPSMPVPSAISALKS